MKINYHEKRLKKRKNNRSLRLISFPISVGIVPDILLIFKYLGIKIEKELSQKEIKKKKK